MAGYEAAFKTMVVEAKKYLDAQTDFMTFYYAIREAWHYVRMFAPDSRLAELVKEWLEMSDRYRNEWGVVTSPLSQEEFRRWLEQQL
jgi:hypothetical protein